MPEAEAQSAMLGPRKLLVNRSGLQKSAKHLDSCRPMSGVVVVRVGEYLIFPFANLPQNVRPLSYLGPPVDDQLVPDLRLLLDSFAISKPTNVGEAGSNGIELLEPLRGPGHP